MKPLQTLQFAVVLILGGLSALWLVRQQADEWYWLCNDGLERISPSAVIKAAFSTSDCWVGPFGSTMNTIARTHDAIVGFLLGVPDADSLWRIHAIIVFLSLLAGARLLHLAVFTWPSSNLAIDAFAKLSLWLLNAAATGVVGGAAWLLLTGRL